MNRLIPALTVVALLAIPRVAPAEEFFVAMRDKVELATDVHLPPRGGPTFPAVLIRSVYPREDGPQSVIIQRLVERYRVGLSGLGIALVFQETRGKGRSEGQDPMNSGDLATLFTDTEDTLRWIRSRSWTNGRIGGAGQSAWGISQVLMPAHCASSLRCQAISFAPSRFYGEVAYQGGVFRESLVRPWMLVNGTPATFATWKAHPLLDEYWPPFDTATHLPDRPVPALHIGGWFDSFCEGTLRNFQLRGGSRGGQRLIIGPFGHVISARLGDLGLRDNFYIDLNAAEMRWLDHWLNGTRNGVASEPAVRYYTLGDVTAANAPGNEWRTAADWPPFETEETPYFLGCGGRLLRDAPLPEGGQCAFTSDPADPVPTYGAAANPLLAFVLTRMPLDQSALRRRPDVLHFATPPLETPLEVTGNARVRLFVATDAPDTDLAARLVDVYPDGREILMLHGIRRLRFRGGFEEAQAVKRGSVVPVEIDLGSISIVFNRGHRIGLLVCGSSFPYFAVNPNNGDDFLGGRKPRVARNTVLMSTVNPSALLLPVRQ